MNYDNGINISLDEIKRFVYKAKTNAFASSADKTSLTDQTSIYSYRDISKSSQFKGLIYNDRYNGNLVEGGQETVSADLAAIWRDQYYGGTIHDSFPDKLGISATRQWAKFISVFLKQALMATPADFPVRGPKKFSREQVKYDGNTVIGEWLYNNDWEAIPLFQSKDPFASFRGYETILFNDKIVFWHVYHGGLILDKYYPFVLV